MSKLPAFQFYPGDWMKDPNLRRCSHAARGVWMDMLCLMFECEERGVLISADGAWSDSDIAAAIGGDRHDTISCISELLTKGVARKDNRGAIFSARMTRDENIRKTRAKCGRKGGKQKASKRLANGVANFKQTTEDEDEVSTPEGVQGEPPWVAGVLTDWLAYKRERGEGYKARGLAALRAGILEMGEATARAALKHSMASNYAGLFPPKGLSHGQDQQSPARIAAKPGKYARVGQTASHVGHAPPDTGQAA